jgi:hypothetical protein
MAIGGKGDFLQWEILVLKFFDEVVHSWLRTAAEKKNVKRPAVFFGCLGSQFQRRKLLI